jgi:hypothetical protein
MMMPGEHRQRVDVALCGALCVDRRALPDALVRPSTTAATSKRAGSSMGAQE